MNHPAFVMTHAQFARPQRVPRVADVPTKPASVLLVEDEAIVALDLKMQLEDLGYDVIGIADTAARALDMAERHRPDVTLMDVVLQGQGDGIDAAAAMRERGCLPVVFLTSFSDHDSVRRAAETAPYGYLTKPFQIRELRAGIEVALSKSRLERQLRESERWYAATLRCVQDSIVVTDASGRIRYLNAAAERLLGRGSDEVTGSSVDAVVIFDDTPSEARAPTTALLPALRSGHVVGVRHGRALRRPDGSSLTVDEWAGPVVDDEGLTMGGVLVLRDAADRLAMEGQAAELADERTRRERSEHAARMKTDFLARVSHEMRTPLNAVMGFAQLLRMQTGQAAAPQNGLVPAVAATPSATAVAPAHAAHSTVRYADHILTAGQHLLGLVDDVLELQAPEPAQRSLTLTAVRLSNVVDEAMVLVQPMAVTHGVTLTRDVDAALTAQADERRLRQILVNLLSNAVKYNRPGGHVICSTGVDTEGRVAVRVVDDGIGMTAEQMGRLFAPFDRLGREHTTVQGVGLGLVISRKLAEQMGGTVNLRSVHALGTTATVELQAH